MMPRIIKIFLIWFPEEVSKEGQIASDADLGVQFTEIFIKNEENISMLLSLLEVCDCTYLLVHYQIVQLADVIKNKFKVFINFFINTMT